MRVGERFTHDYDWDDAAAELEDGVHPEVVAARIGEPIDLVLTTAARNDWPITWCGMTADQYINAYLRCDA